MPTLTHLHSVAVCCLVALIACDEAKPAPAASRVVAVAAPKAEANEREFCDVRFPSGTGPAFALPSVEGSDDDKRRAAEPGKARWINVWATWCPPCVEELPLLTRLSANFAKQGLGASLVLLSVDSGAEPVAKFAREHPEALHSLRIREAGALEPWLKSIGLDAGATLPAHVFVDAGGRILCTRTGAVRDSDVASIQKLLEG